MRISLKLRDLNRAARRLTELEDQKFGRPRRSIAAAIEAFHAQGAGLAAETKRKYKRILRSFGEFCETSSLVYVDSIDVEALTFGSGRCG